jgi:aspartyl-tRNA(Asn)/glutamyl-tRNA(Gln) amidotransferase subunit A
MITMLETAKRLKQGLTTPDELIGAALAAARDSEHVFIAVMDQRAINEAKASTERWRQRASLSPFDGIPYAAKDLLDAARRLHNSDQRTVCARGCCCNRRTCVAGDDPDR